MPRIYFATKDPHWKAKMVKKLRDEGLDYDETTDWKECEIIVADLNFKLKEFGQILVMMAERRGVPIKEPPPVIYANPTGARGGDFENLRECIFTYLKCKPHIYENDDDIVNFIKWFDHFLPRNPPSLPQEVLEMVAKVAETDAMKPGKT